MARMPFERKLDGHICSDNAVGAHKLRLFVRLRTLVASGIFWLLFFRQSDLKSHRWLKSHLRLPSQPNRLQATANNSKKLFRSVSSRYIGL